MARYGRDLGMDRTGGYRGGMNRYGTDNGFGTGSADFRGGYYGRQGYGGRGGNQDSYGPAYGGMRSDAYGTDWNDFPGEQGWYGAGYAGYPGGEPRGGSDMGYGGYGAGTPGTYGGYTDALEQRGGYGGGRMGRQRGQQGGGRMRASEIMTENPETVTPDTAITDVAKKMKDLNVGIIPVVESADSKRLKGVITDRDLAIRVLAEGKDGKLKVSDCMTTDVETVNKNDHVQDVLNLMERDQVRRVPITDREGRLVGIIAQADLAVEYAEGRDRRERDVEEAIERISEPARPDRNRGGMRARNR
jgi:CBS-domain-containing membrane protein